MTKSIKKVSLGLTAAVLVASISTLGLVGCGGSGEASISVINRESGSGTRSGFEEIIGFTSDEVATFESVEAQTCTFTGAVITAISSNARKSAIGYASLSAVEQNKDKVKALSFDGVAANETNIANGTYKLSRPFVLVTKDETALSVQAQDFFNYVLSSDAQGIITAEGLVSTSDAHADYTTAEGTVTGTVALTGSTSMTDVINQLLGEYNKLQPGVTFTTTFNGSGAGISAVNSGTCDIGLSSRALKSSETGMTGTTMAVDGIAVIVHKDLDLTNLSKQQVHDIWVGTTTKFSEVK